MKSARLALETMNAQVAGLGEPTALARYGLLGAALSFVALPLYIVLPSHYAALGSPLAALGAILLGARLLDAVVDPWLGRWADASLGRSRGAAWRLALAAAVVLALGFSLLFFPPALAGIPLLAWCAATLVLTYLGFSMLTVLHQAWGARLGGDARYRAQVVSCRRRRSHWCCCSSQGWPGWRPRPGAAAPRSRARSARGICPGATSSSGCCSVSIC
jgi:Na+/melibiose symporter-like transporter